MGNEILDIVQYRGTYINGLRIAGALSGRLVAILALEGIEWRRRTAARLVLRRGSSLASPWPY